MTPRLITISWSHFCEKARWALERSGIAFEERAHLAIFHYGAVLLSRGGISVPTLETDDGTIGDSTDILKWIAARPQGAWLYPAACAEDALAVEERCDEVLGVGARRIAYFHVIRDAALARAMDLSSVPRWQRALLPWVFPLAGLFLRLRLRVTEATVAADRTRVFALLDELAARLADGRRFLCGDAFTAADLTFAALLTPILLPPEVPQLPRYDAVKPAYREVVDAVRAHAAGQWALQLYSDERAVAARVRTPDNRDQACGTAPRA